MKMTRGPVCFRQGFIVFIELGDDAFQIRDDVVAVLISFDLTPVLIWSRRYSVVSTPISPVSMTLQVIVHVVVDLGIAADDGFDILDERVFRLF